jgi:hypothetical protein
MRYSYLILENFVLVFLDDIIVYNKTKKEHLSHVITYF